MKKLTFAVMLLLGLSIMLYSCVGNSSTGYAGEQNNTENVDEYSEDEYEGDSETDDAPIVDLPTFHTEMDVIAFLNLKVFEDEQGNTIQVKTDAIYYNGQPVTTVPRAKEFYGCEATIVAKDPAGYGNFVLWLVENSGRLFLKDMSSGENYYLK